MSKKKMFKADGSEDFDAEALEPDEVEAAAPGLIDGDSTPKSDDKPAESDAAKSEDTAKPAEPTADAAPAEAAPEIPADFGELHGDVKELGEHLGADAIDELKKAGNALTPAVSKLHGIEAKFEHLGDEAKARFIHAKTMVVNAMGALERLFKRGK
jgi:hypothetical protein